MKVFPFQNMYMAREYVVVFVVVVEGQGGLCPRRRPPSGPIEL